MITNVTKHVLFLKYLYKKDRDFTQSPKHNSSDK
jgi:hypothetical protein